MTSSERQFWSAYEPVHAVVYFHPAFAEGLAERGLHGWWNGYFAGRAAPLGAVTAPVVTALFFGFAPSMVARAVPKVWGRITPEDAVAAHLDTADRVLGELIGQGSSDDAARVAGLLERAVDACAFDGRGLASAWAAVERPTSVAARLWLAASVLREHRGDGHVVAATERGLSGLQTGITHVATEKVDREQLQTARGWTDESWDAAERELRERGVLTDDGGLTAEGARLRDELEQATDRLACPPSLLGENDSWAVGVLAALGRLVVDRGIIPVPNPIGLARP